MRGRCVPRSVTRYVPRCMPRCVTRCVPTWKRKRWTREKEPFVKFWAAQTITLFITAQPQVRSVSDERSV